MQKEIIISGFGGQGVLFAGQLLSYAAMDEGLQTTWIPSYGPEMRGGTANCTVVIADEEIGSPFVRNPQAVLVMNNPSLIKYEPLVSVGGLMVINSTIVDIATTRTDIHIMQVPANELAESLGDRRVTNMVMLGTLLANLPILTIESIERAMKNHLGARYQKFFSLNSNALHKGAEYQLPQPA